MKCIGVQNVASARVVSLGFLGGDAGRTLHHAVNPVSTFYPLAHLGLLVGFIRVIGENGGGTRWCLIRELLL